MPLDKKAILGGTLLCGGAVAMGISLQAQKRSKSKVPLVKPEIIDAQTALQNYDFIHISHELEAILEDMGRFYTVAPEKYCDMLEFCNELVHLSVQVDDSSITLRKSDVGRAIKYKISALAAATSIRSDIYEKYPKSFTMMQSYTNYLNDLEAKLKDIVHNISQAVYERT